MAKRVHQLAKELGVKSTAIVSKCQAEGLSIKNHMSTLSAGLEATIMEWFSSVATATTVETTAPVDLEKVKTKPKRVRKKKVKAAEEAETEAETEAIEEGEEKTSKKSPKSKPKRISPKDRESAEEGAEVVGEVDEQEAVDAVEVKSKAKKERSKPSKPVPFVPTPAVMKGPKVVRTEKADVVPIPSGRPVRKGRGSPAAEISSPVLPDDFDLSKTGGRKGSHRSVKLEGEDKSTRRGKNKSQRRRGSRKYESLGNIAMGTHEFGDRDLRERQERLASASGNQLHRRERRLAHEEHEASGATGTMERKRIEKVSIKEPITVKELSSAIGVRAAEIIGKLMSLGVMATINHVIDSEAAESVAIEYGIELEIEEKKLLLDELREEFDKENETEEMQPRPPVVAFLGHVDHGKTSLLDRIRQASVTAGEAGGITQHIGSYLYNDGKHQVTFLDTPGHKAFTEMRARGANMTDIVVLVVAADDGVMPQTSEAISHAKAAGVPVVVALNKMDLPGADENKTLGQLAEKDLVTSEWGGDIEVVKTSATTGEGVEDLVEHLEYVAELQQLKARITGKATGWIIESQMSTSQGVIARLLVKEGVLNNHDVVVAGSSYGRIRTLTDATGAQLDTAGPATPVVITGMDIIPVAGERFFVVDSISRASEIASEQKAYEREKDLAQHNQITLDNLFSEIAAGEVRELNVVLKADVQGSVDVLRQAITELNTAEVAVRILHAAVGGISESDVLLAQASNAIIIGFQVIADEHSRLLAERKSVEIRLYNVIYKITDEIKLALEGMLAPSIEEKSLGRAVVRQIFRISRIGVIAGCYVTEGVISRSAKVRLIRDGVVIRDSNAIDSLRREKDDASEVRSGLECGIKLVGFDDVKVDDEIEAYELVEVTRTLESSMKNSST